MKPYEVEIFDRDFNFIYNALIEELSYNFDAVTPEKSTISLPISFNPSKLSNDARAPRGWYIRILRDDEEYQGVIYAIEYGDTSNKVTIAQLVTLFDLNIWVETQAITRDNVEHYIATVIENTFKYNTDSVQNITGLQVFYAEGDVYGSLDYCNTDNEYTVINVLNDLINKAYSTYGIYTKVIADFHNKHLTATVSVIGSNTKTIEGDLPNIIDSQFTIKESSGTETNKVVIKDVFSGNITYYYLYSDGTYGTNINPTGKSRIYPVVTSVILINTYDLAKENVDAKYEAYIDILRDYAMGSTVLTTTEYNTLKTACDALMPYYINDISLTYSFNKIYDSPGSGMPSLIYDFSQSSLAIASEVKIIQRNYDRDGYGAKFEHYGADNKSILYGTEYDQQYNFYGHAAIRVTIEVAGNYSTGGSTISVDGETEDNIPFDYEAGNKAFTAYKKTANYDIEIRENTDTAAIHDIMESKATAEFSKNKYSNLIELTVKPDDSMINPLSLDIGQTVNVIHDGVSYNSILTGREIKGGLVKLIFGTIRLDLTKILNMKGV